MRSSRKYDKDMSAGGAYMEIDLNGRGDLLSFSLDPYLYDGSSPCLGPTKYRCSNSYYYRISGRCIYLHKRIRYVRLLA